MAFCIAAAGNVDGSRCSVSTTTAGRLYHRWPSVADVAAVPEQESEWTAALNGMASWISKRHAAGDLRVGKKAVCCTAPTHVRLYTCDG